MTATSTCSSSQNLGFEGGGVGYYQVTVPANAVNVRVSATDTVGVDPTTGTHTSYGFQSRSTNSASCTITVADLSAINVAVAAACVSPSASVRQDPHLHFAHGGQADFRGRNGVYYAFYSGPYLAVNVKTQDASFWLQSASF